MSSQRWHYTYSFWVIGLQVYDVVVWENPPCFTEQISITIKTLGKKTWNIVTLEMKKTAKVKSTTAFSSARVICLKTQVLVLYKICYHIIWQSAAVWTAVCSLCWKVTAFLLLDSFLSFPFPLNLCAQWGEQWAG